MTRMYKNLFSIAGLMMGASLLTTGCAYDENLVIANIQGTVVVPRAAATRIFVDADGVETELTDVRLIGPVYLGLFPAVLPPNNVASYSHPEVGPQYIEGIQGDTYPYGGTTVGDIKYACFEFLTCKVITGRYVDFDSLASWFADTLQQPILDANDLPVTNGEYVRQTCFDLLEVTSDEEIQLTAIHDRNNDDKLDENDLDFVENKDGDFEATFKFIQQDWYWDQRDKDCTPGIDCTSFSLWGFMDAPSTISNLFSTCDSGAGYRETTYTNDYYGGRPHMNVLNQPSTYISIGDWVADEGYVWDDMFEQPTIRLGFEVTQ
jgi:hypothetical protein